MINFNFPEKGLGLVPPSHFVYVIAFTSPNIGQYVYYGCLLTRL